MRLTWAIGAALAAILALVWAIGLEWPRVFLALMWPVSAVVVLSLGALSFRLAMWVLSGRLPPGLRRDYEDRPHRWDLAAALWVGGTVYGLVVLNEYWSASWLTVPCLAGDAALLAFLATSGLSVIRPHRALLLVPAALLLLALGWGIENVKLEPGAESAAPRERLMALGYVGWTEVVDANQRYGVVVHDRERASPGFTLMTSTTKPQAALIDMEGRVVHMWRHPRREPVRWSLGELASDGDLLVVAEKSEGSWAGRLLRLDWDSRPVWEIKIDVHHDVDATPHGDIYALRHDVRLGRFAGLPAAYVDETILHLGRDGELLRSIPLAPWFRFTVPPERSWSYLRLLSNPLKIGFQTWTHWPCLPQVVCYDPFHANQVEWIDRDVRGLARRGDLLVSLKNMDTVAVLDGRTGEPRWQWGSGELSGQHQPSLLANGNILIFDNGMRNRASRLVDVDPVERSIVWEYRADPPDDFFTATQGGAQRLPNGNTLATESYEGRIFEVTRGGDVVWEYRLRPEREGWRRVFYRAERYELGDPRLSRLDR